MRQLAWSLFQLLVGYVIVGAFEGVIIGIGPFCLIVVAATFVVSVIAAVAFRGVRRLFRYRPERRQPARLRRVHREPVLTEWR